VNAVTVVVRLRVNKVATEAGEQECDLGLGAQEKTRGH
jgi:hypothetical protein